jgi:hypothetical protein
VTESIRLHDDDIVASTKNGYYIVEEDESAIFLNLSCMDPVQWVFEHIRIWRRVYSVPGPNSLWHHDGQHGEQ